MRNFLNPILRKFGWELRRTAALTDPLLAGFPDLSAAERDIIRAVQPFTMSSPERIANVILTVKHVVQQRVPGDIVECGVWRGGCMMAAALTLRSLDETGRRLYLYDTFEGMPPPEARDRSHDGQQAEQQLAEATPQTGVWCYADEADVRRNLRDTGYPEDNVVFVAGNVEATIPGVLPDRIALLRLDTDWYQSTCHELQHLYPQLQHGGVLIIDDYGHWEGARQAVDEYIARLPYPLFLHRIDYTGRCALKPVDSPPRPL